MTDVMWMESSSLIP